MKNKEIVEKIRLQLKNNGTKNEDKGKESLCISETGGRTRTISQQESTTKLLASSMINGNELQKTRSNKKLSANKPPSLVIPGKN